MLELDLRVFPASCAAAALSRCLHGRVSSGPRAILTALGSRGGEGN